MSPGNNFIGKVIEQVVEQEDGTAVDSLLASYAAFLSPEEFGRARQHAMNNYGSRPGPDIVLTMVAAAAGGRPTPRSTASAPRLPPVAAGFRDASPQLKVSAPTTAPKSAGWRRRAWAALFGLEKRRDLARRRRALHKLFPRADWKSCQVAAVAARAVDQTTASSLSQVFRICALDRELASMGLAATGIDPAPHLRQEPSRPIPTHPWSSRWNDWP